MILNLDLLCLLSKFKGSAGWVVRPRLLAEQAEEGPGWDCPGLPPCLEQHLGVRHFRLAGADAKKMSYYQTATIITIKGVKTYYQVFPEEPAAGDHP